MKWLTRLILFSLLTTNVYAADNIFGLDGNNLLLDNATRKWTATVVYTTDGSGNVIPIGSSSTVLGAVTQGGQSISAAPWQQDIEQIRGATPSSTNYLPFRLTDGTSYYDSRQIRALTSGTDSVTIQGGNATAVKIDGSAVTQPVSIASPVPVSGTVTANIGTTNGLALDSSITSLSGKFGTLGQKTMSGSAPVTIASDQSALTVSQGTGTNLHTVVDSGTVTANAGTGTFTISGTVTANAGTNLNTSLLATSANQTNASQKSQVVDGSGNVFGPTTTLSAVNYLPVIQASSATAGVAVPARSTLVSGSDGTNAQNLSVDATGKLNVNNISGTVSLPTGASTSANQTNGSQKSQQVDGSGNVAPVGDVVARSLFVAPGDGTRTITVKAASTAAITTDTSQVVALSPNSPIPTGTNSIGTVKAQLQDNAGTAIVLGQTTMSASLPVAIASNQGTLTTTLGNSTGKSVVFVPGNLTSTATTADQVVVTYTVTAGKTFYLQSWDINVQRSTFSSTAADYGSCSLESPAGAKLWTQEFSGAGFAQFDKHISEPAPIAASTVVRIVCTPGATTSTLWRANLIGYEK